MAPVGRLQRAFAVMRAGRGDMRPQRDQPLTQRDDPGIAGRRARFDHEQRVAGFFPHQLSECASLAIADFADHVARHDEVGRIRSGQGGAGFSAFVADVAQAKAVGDEAERQRAQRVVGVEQRKALQRWEGFGRSPGGRARPGADIEQACRREVRPDLDEGVQARRDRGIGRGHPRQRIGERIGLRADGAGAAAVAVGFRDRRGASGGVVARKAPQLAVERGLQFGREVG